MRARSQLLSCLALVAVVRALAGPALADSVVTGLVTSAGRPVGGAIVRVYGGEATAVTGSDGRFRLPHHAADGDLFVTAAKPGYYNVRKRLAPDIGPVHLELLPIPANDNAHYAWQDPTPDPARKGNCGNCHSTIFAQWAGDGHSRAAVNPIVLDMYNGTGAGRANVGPGYRLDWSDAGNCATCHAPLRATREPQADLNALQGVERTGVSCDFCHKISEIASPDRQFIHAADMRVLRPAEGHKLIFGPLDDAIFPGDVPDFSYSPLFNSSRFCAGCHDGASWGIPVYETYSEWRRSPYAAAGVECQQCHMRSVAGVTRIADEEDGGITRPSEHIGSHQMMGSSRADLLKSAVRMETSAAVKGAMLEVTVTIANTGAGHHVPTGQPMRNMVLLVRPVDASDRELRLVSGGRVPTWGGDYSGQPGAGFAKVLATVSEYAAAPSAPDDTAQAGNFPAPFWRRNRIVSDTRIPAKSEVKEVYWFALPNTNESITVTTRLVYRRAFQQLAEIKGWSLADVDLSTNRVNVERQGHTP